MPNVIYYKEAVGFWGAGVKMEDLRLGYPDGKQSGHDGVKERAKFIYGFKSRQTYEHQLLFGVIYGVVQRLRVQWAWLGGTSGGTTHFTQNNALMLPVRCGTVRPIRRH